jgi:hypothetical protein
MQRMQKAAPGVCDDSLPATADVFFTHYTHTSPSSADTLQSTLHAKASSHQYKAAVNELKTQKRQGNGRPWLHHKAITAPAAWAWKTTLPVDPRMEMTDTQYAIAARLSLGLHPFPDMSQLPEFCPLCEHRQTKQPVSLKEDPWHCLSCYALTDEGRTRHDAVVNALEHAALLMGGQVKKEVKGLDRNSNIRPDLLLAFPGRLILSDVVISHSVTKNRETQTANVAFHQSTKRKKYLSTAARLGAELLPFSLDTYGGLSTDAMKLVHAMGEAGEEAMGMWSKRDIVKYVMGVTSIANQRGNAMVVLAAYTRTMTTTREGARREAQKESESNKKREAVMTENDRLLKEDSCM